MSKGPSSEGLGRAIASFLQFANTFFQVGDYFVFHIYNTFRNSFIRHQSWKLGENTTKPANVSQKSIADGWSFLFLTETNRKLRRTRIREQLRGGHRYFVFVK